MPTDARTCRRRRFPAEAISHAVRLHHLLSLRLRGVERILAGRGVMVTYGTVRRRCRGIGAEFAASLRRRRPRPGDTWRLGEVLIRIDGAVHDVQRAVD